MSASRYNIVKLLGKGRTGGVYKAEDENLQRSVAMRRFFDRQNEVSFAEHGDAFVEVAQSLSNLQHPNLLRIFDAGVDDDGPYIVSQLLEGKSLHDELLENSLEIDDVVTLAREMLDAFSMAHDRGYYHGALTPGSILLTPSARGGYRAIILDMGLSRISPLIQGPDSMAAIMADPAILAPELFDGSEVDARADLYMLGQILYMSLAGGHPFGGLSFAEAKQKHLKGLPSISKKNKSVPKDLATWLSSLIAVDPSDRPLSAVEALNSLPKYQLGGLSNSANTAMVSANGEKVNLITKAGVMIATYREQKILKSRLLMVMAILILALAVSGLIIAYGK